MTLQELNTFGSYSIDMHFGVEELVHNYALAGDQALWDLCGKAWNVPVYQLLERRSEILSVCIHVLVYMNSIE